MKISIIAPNLDEAKYLPAFLNSLVHQCFKDFEVVIIDGGSTDKSLEIISEFSSQLNIKVIMDETRNIGYVRNLGSRYAKGNILFHTSSDTILEPNLLRKLSNFFDWKPYVISVAGRTVPLGTSIISRIAYKLFDFLRFLFTLSPMPVKKYRPSGNFFTIRKRVFRELGGFPEVTINEDGLLGQKLDEYIRGKCRSIRHVVFHRTFFVGHHVKRFEKVGGVTSLLFYIYVLGNLFPLLKPLLKHIELRSGRVFSERSDLKSR